MASAKDKHVTNGIDMGSLGQTVQAIQDDPSKGQSRFRVRNHWISGGHNQTTVQNFHSLDQEVPHKHRFELEADEPTALGGTDEGPNPVEHLLNALAACVTTSMVAHAAVRGIQVDEVESTVEGDIDLQGFFGLDPGVPKGYKNITIDFKVKAAPEDVAKLEEFAAFSPVFNTITQGTQVNINIQNK